MTALSWGGLLLAGGFGAVLRFIVDRQVMSRTAGRFPSGTLAVNLTGAVVLGGLSGLAPDPHITFLVGTGVIGAYTTFSTWMLETQRLTEEHQYRLAIVNVVASITCGLAAATCGQLIGEHL
ncbi:fluoride efflux transporter CrcB [Mycobacterium sp. 141]|uniref:fluoride efflux transporter CrcB n=1 Tax=Mycobacterium sp. 141 TaxID=1120797 RepID=UPI00037C2099|nr:fluoride efflux transporter CrcB [Mycobacterium sp. 141]